MIAFALAGASAIAKAVDGDGYTRSAVARIAISAKTADEVVRNVQKAVARKHRCAAES